MKILFIHTAIHRFDPEEYSFDGTIGWDAMQFGISYISGSLKKVGHETKLLFINRKKWEKDVLRCLANFNPDIVCLDGVSTQFRHVLDIAKTVKRFRPGIYLVFGGIHATLAKPDIKILPFDAICIGEGEFPMVELAEALESGKGVRGIKNFIIQEKKNIYINPVRNFIENVDSLPFPDRDMWKRYVGRGVFGKNVILLSRGCPFNCTYCSNEVLRGIAPGRYVRYRAPEKIVEEIIFLRQEFAETDEIYLETETITGSMEWLEALCGALCEFNSKTNKKPLSFGANIRINQGANYSRIFSMLKNAHFTYVKIGIESGSERVRKEILKRNYSNEEIARIFNEAKKARIKAHAYNMLGLPGEKPLDFEETIKINRICQPEDTHLSIFFPYPGTELYELCKKNGFLRKNICSLEEREEPAINTGVFPPGKIKDYYARFDFEVYKGKRSNATLALRYLYKKYIIKNRISLKIYAAIRRILKSALFITKSK